MVYPAPFIRLVLGGGLYANSEQWTCSLSIANGSQLLAAPEVVPIDVREACVDWITSANNFSTGADLRWIKFNLIGINGRYAEPVTVRYDFTGSYPSGAQPTNPPPQISLAHTLRTDVERGLAARGRFYAPLPGRNLASSGMLGGTDQAAYATAATTFLNDLNTAMSDYATDGGAPRVVVMSDVGAGMLRTVKNVAVGRVLDTMRSRRSSLTENYVEGSDLLP